MYPQRLLIALGLAAFLGSLVVLAPVRPVLGWLPQGITHNVTDAGGRVSEGFLRLQGQAGEVALRWQLQPGWLAALALGGQWQAEGPGLRAEGDFLFWPWRYRLDVRDGELAPDRIARLSGSLGLTLDQPLRLQGVSLSGTPGVGVSSVDGVLAWGPGQVSVSGRPAPLSVPALHGNLETQEGVMRLDVEDQGNPGQTLATAEVDRAAGTLRAALLVRGANLFGLPAQPGQAPDKPFVELSQPLR